MRVKDSFYSDITDLYAEAVYEWETDSDSDIDIANEGFVVGPGEDDSDMSSDYEEVDTLESRFQTREEKSK